MFANSGGGGSSEADVLFSDFCHGPFGTYLVKPCVVRLCARGIQFPAKLQPRTGKRFPRSGGWLPRTGKRVSRSGQYRPRNGKRFPRSGGWLPRTDKRISRIGLIHRPLNRHFVQGVFVLLDIPYHTFIAYIPRFPTKIHLTSRTHGGYQMKPAKLWLGLTLVFIISFAILGYYGG